MTTSGVQVADGDQSLVRRGLVFGIMSYAVGVVISIGTSIVSSRRFGVGNIGAYALVMTLWLLVQGLSSANEQAALILELHGLAPRSEDVSGRFYAVATFSAAFTIFVAAIAAVIGGLVLAHGADRPDLVLPAIALLAAYVVFDNTSWNMQTVLSSFRAGRDLFVVRTAQYLTLLVGIVVMSFVSRTVWGLVLAQISSFVVEFLLTIFMFKKVFAFRCSRAAIRRGFSRLPAILRLGGTAAIGSWVQAFGSQVGTWVFGSISPVVEVGSYARAAGLTSKVPDIGIKVGEIAYPTFVDHRARRDGERFDRLFLDLSRFFLVVMGATIVGSAVAGRAILRIFGPGFEHASTAMTILAVGAVVQLVNGLQYNALFACGQPRWTMLTDVLRTAITLALIVPLIHRSGAAGFALSVASGIAGSFIVRSLVLGRTVFAPRASLTFVSLVLRWLFALGISVWIGRALAGPAQRGTHVVVGLAAALAAYVLISVGLKSLTVGDLRRALRRAG